MKAGSILIKPQCVLSCRGRPPKYTLTRTDFEKYIMQRHRLIITPIPLLTDELRNLKILYPLLIDRKFEIMPPPKEMSVPRTKVSKKPESRAFI